MSDAYRGLGKTPVPDNTGQSLNAADPWHASRDVATAALQGFSPSSQPKTKQRSGGLPHTVVAGSREARRRHLKADPPPQAGAAQRSGRAARPPSREASMSAPNRSRDARLNGRIGGLTYAANTPPDELSARGRRAFEARMERLEAEADPDGKLAPHLRRRRAEARLRLEMTKLSAHRWRRHHGVVDLAVGGPPNQAFSRSISDGLGQFLAGEANPQARHNDETVLRARELRAAGWDLRRIAAEVGADHGTVGRWCRGETRRTAQEARP